MRERGARLGGRASDDRWTAWGPTGFTPELVVGAAARNAVVSPRIGLGYGWDVARVVTGGVEVSVGRVSLTPQAFVRGSGPSER